MRKQKIGKNIRDVLIVCNSLMLFGLLTACGNYGDSAKKLEEINVVEAPEGIDDIYDMQNYNTALPNEETTETSQEDESTGTLSSLENTTISEGDWAAYDEKQKQLANDIVNGNVQEQEELIITY